MTKKNFTAVKTTANTSAASPEYDPDAIVRQYLDHRASSVKAEVTGELVLHKGYTALKKDPNNLNRLLDTLVAVKVLSKSDAELAWHAKKSMFSMLTKIGEHADVILHEKIVPFLQPGYSVLYQLALLIEHLKANPDTIDRLAAILQTCPGPVTRRWLENAREQLATPPRVAESVIAGSNENAEDDRERAELPSTERPEGALADSVHETPARIDRSVPVGVLVLTPSGLDVSRLNKPYIAGGEPACLRYHDAVAPNAVLMLMARVGDLTRLAEKLPLWGFRKFKAIYALAPPSGPSLMDVDVMAICERGQSDLVKGLEDWPAERDPIKLAESLLKEVTGRRVHLFADIDAPGYECLVGDANWSMEAGDE